MGSWIQAFALILFLGENLHPSRSCDVNEVEERVGEESGLFNLSVTFAFFRRINIPYVLQCACSGTAK